MDLDGGLQGLGHGPPVGMEAGVNQLGRQVIQNLGHSTQNIIYECLVKQAIIDSVCKGLLYIL